MAAGLGLGVGNTNAVAVLHTGGSPRLDAEPAIARLCTLQLTVAGEAVLGSPLDAPDVISGFAVHAGDPAGLEIGDGSAYLAEDLVATAMHSLVHEAAETFPGLSEQPEIVATHPPRWSDATVQSMRGALEHVGLAAVTLVPEPVAAVAWLESAHGPLGDAVVAVFDLGGAGLDVSLVRTGADAGLLRPSTFTTRFGGDTFDQAVVEHVLGVVAVGLGPIDPSDPVTRVELSVLRHRCAEAREALSTATEARVTVELAGTSATVTLTRTELEELLESSVAGALDLVEQTISAHDLAPSDVRTVLLTGGCCAMPLVSRLAASTLGLPTVLGPRPGLTGAHGAAITAAGGASITATGGATIDSAGGATIISAGAATVATGAADIDGDADTVTMPAVHRVGPPAAFTEAGPGRPVLPVLTDADPLAPVPAATPTPAPPRGRFERTTVITAAAGLVLAVALVGLVVSLRSTDAPATAVPVIDPSTTARVTTSPRPTTTTTKAPTPTTTRTTTTRTTTTAPTTTVVPTTEDPPPVTTVPVVEPSPSPQPTTTTPAATTTADPTTTTTTATPTTTATTPTATPKATPKAPAAVA
ncbi:Hsp70 family protein [Rhodococcus sp. NPDC058514]|uniref:Hsp70 family protein n=1 Tax=unclassified Rhodococcus (in: high G+C Gram-positive bacteria) TaxID=192944 RepID=UPI003647D516